MKLKEIITEARHIQEPSLGTLSFEMNADFLWKHGLKHFYPGRRKNLTPEQKYHFIQTLFSIPGVQDKVENWITKEAKRLGVGCNNFVPMGDSLYNQLKNAVEREGFDKFMMNDRPKSKQDWRF